MRFIARADRAKYVVKPARKGMDLNTGETTSFPGLRARFFGHVFDSEISQRQLGWTDEERKRVEKHLLAHYDFDKPNGYYLEDRQHATAPRAAIGNKMLRCLAFFPNDDGDLEQCPSESLADREYCAQHEPTAEIVADAKPAPPMVEVATAPGRPILAAGVM
jgi:hypothetical protein